MLDTGLYIMYALFLVAVLSAVGLSLMNALKNPGSFGKSMIGIVALFALFGICYAISDATVQPTWVVMGITPKTVKLIGGGLLTLYLTGLVAVIGLIYSEITKAFK